MYTAAPVQPQISTCAHLPCTESTLQLNAWPQNFSAQAKWSLLRIRAEPAQPHDWDFQRPIFCLEHWAFWHLLQTSPSLTTCEFLNCSSSRYFHEANKHYHAHFEEVKKHADAQGSWNELRSEGNVHQLQHIDLSGGCSCLGKKKKQPHFVVRLLFERRDLQRPKWLKWCTVTSLLERFVLPSSGDHPCVGWQTLPGESLAQQKIITNSLKVT